jgi:hypothetical protein
VACQCVIDSFVRSEYVCVILKVLNDISADSENKDTTRTKRSRVACQCVIDLFVRSEYVCLILKVPACLTRNMEIPLVVLVF